MPLTRQALDELLDTLQEDLMQRLEDAYDNADLWIWLERCVVVIDGFADNADRAYVETRLAGCLALLPVPPPLSGLTKP